MTEYAIAMSNPKGELIAQYPLSKVHSVTRIDNNSGFKTCISVASTSWNVTNLPRQVSMAVAALRGLQQREALEAARGGLGLPGIPRASNDLVVVARTLDLQCDNRILCHVDCMDPRKPWVIVRTSEPINFQENTSAPQRPDPIMRPLPDPDAP